MLDQLNKLISWIPVNYYYFCRFTCGIWKSSFFNYGSFFSCIVYTMSDSHGLLAAARQQQLYISMLQISLTQLTSATFTTVHTLLNRIHYSLVGPLNKLEAQVRNWQRFCLQLIRNCAFMPSNSKASLFQSA